MTDTITEIPKLPPAPKDAHKGLFGKILIIGGNRGMIGAPALAANAAFRSGAGLVRLATPESIQLYVASLAPCATSIPLPEDGEGRIGTAAIKQITECTELNDAIVLGPGLGHSNQLQAIVTRVVTEISLPTVLDADGLNCLATAASGSAGQKLALRENLVLTPHPGEMRRLWASWFREERPADRTEQAEKLAQRAGCVVVLKGAGTVVSDGNSTYVNSTGSPALATGGSGDVLSGMIAALLARQEDVGALSPLNAAILGVYVHGRAGELAGETLGPLSTTAWDLLDFLPKAWREVAEP